MQNAIAFAIESGESEKWPPAKRNLADGLALHVQGVVQVGSISAPGQLQHV